MVSTSTINHIDKLFIDSFSELGLAQCVSGPTHTKGKTLDILLTNSQHIVSNVKVSSQELICKSDHYAITFDIKSNIKNKKFTKRKIYNFKKANWDQLNRELRGVSWNAIIDCTEPEIAWSKFKEIFLTLLTNTFLKSQ